MDNQLECDSCKQSFSVKEIKIKPKIVRKQKVVAIAYCFKCPECGKEYACYFKDSKVNAMFRKGEKESARKRMAYLKELFTNDSSV